MEKEERISHCIIFSSHDHFYRELMYRKKDILQIDVKSFSSMYGGKLLNGNFKLKSSHVYIA